MSGDGIPALCIGNGAPIDEVHALAIHIVAKVVVDAVVREAVDELTQAVAGATQWLTQAVRDELISQAVVAAEPPVSPEEVEEDRENPKSITKVPELELIEHLPLLSRPSNADVHAVAKMVVDVATGEAVKGVVQSIEKATESLFIQAVVTEEPPNSPDEVEENHESPSITAVPELVSHLPLVSRPSSAVVHAVAKATVDAAMDEAVKWAVQAVEKATEWFIQPVGNELVTDAMDVGVHNATEWITQAARSELDAHTVSEATPPSDTSTISLFDDQQEFDATTEVETAHEVRRVSFRVSGSSVDNVRELAKATAEAAVHKALQNIARAISDASERFDQAVHVELLAQTVDEEAPPADEMDINSIDPTNLEETRELPPSIEAVNKPVHVPALQLPNSSIRLPDKCHDLAVPFVNEVVSSALHRAVPSNSIEPDDDGYDGYTPINTPTAEEALSSSPLPSAHAPEQESQTAPPVVLSGRATPPDSKPTTRRSPITSKRGLGTPSTKTSPASASPAISASRPTEDLPRPASPAISASSLGGEPSMDFSEPELPQPILPPLVLPVIQGAQLSSRPKHLHKMPLKTPRHTSSPSLREDSTLKDSPRASTSSPRLNKHTSRTAELELTPLSSARAAALIYAQQPPSSRRHHHYKSKKLHDTASQTSPPPSPPPSTLVQEPLLPTENVDSYTTELPKTQISHVKHSTRDLPSTDGSNNTVLAPLSKTPIGPDTTKSQSPSRTHRNHGHSHKGGGGGPSPNKRSGYCQRCAFEGRSCKINDCLKHQVLK